MDKIPMDWIDKLFLCMEQFYGEKWYKMLGTIKPELWKSMWQSALTGLDYNTIKKTLKYYQWESKKHPGYFPPHHLDFYHKAKCSTWNIRGESA